MRVIPQELIPEFQSSLLRWYGKHARALPWRRTKDPYKVWVSEIMLQQTQVETVIPYFNRWVKSFPTVKKLADSPLEDVLGLWAGLGYYRRARMLHEAAKVIVEKHKGKLPEEAAELMELPGIGRYTTGAIASIAFGRKAPILDGNVIRILSRIAALKEDVALPAALKRLWHAAETLVPEDNPGDFNQAMMELGATVCFPANPQCKDCPMTSICKAHAEGLPAQYPVKERREKLEALERFALVLRDGKDRVLLRRQPESGRWGGLWMFPHWDKRTFMIKEFGLTKKALRPVGMIQHGFTRFRVSLNVYEHAWEESKRPLLLKEPDGSENRWVAVKELHTYALPSPHLKIAKQLTQGTHG